MQDSLIFVHVSCANENCHAMSVVCSAVSTVSQLTANDTADTKIAKRRRVDRAFILSRCQPSSLKPPASNGRLAWRTARLVCGASLATRAPATVALAGRRAANQVARLHHAAATGVFQWCMELAGRERERESPTLTG